MIVISSLMSCGLGLQENFEYQESGYEIGTITMSPYQWVMSNPDSAFDYLSVAIDHAGMRDHFETPGRTFFLITDGAWEGPTGIISRLGGADSLAVTDLPVEPLRRVLLYHTIDAFVDQAALPKEDTEYDFQTMLEGELGEMIIVRENLRYRFDINMSDRLPSTALGTRINRHNYRFENGSVAHQTTTLLRYSEEAY
ncbi:MAG: hypothetical protein AAF616_16010 [Bacteroidota bacterium]